MNDFLEKKKKFMEKRKNQVDSVIEATELWIKELKSKKIIFWKKRKIARWECMKKALEERIEQDPLEEWDKLIENTKVLYKPLIRDPNYDTTGYEKILKMFYQMKAELEADIEAERDPIARLIKEKEE